MDGNFSETEQRELSALVNESFHFRVHNVKDVEHQVNVTGAVLTGGVMDNPVRGIFDPVGIVRRLSRIRNPGVTRVGAGFGYNYARGRELDDVVEKVVEIVDEFLAAPAFGTVDGLVFLRKLCGKWVGDARRDELLEALIAMHEAYRLKAEAAAILSGNYYGVSMRTVNRPLVILPNLLTAEEEAYFLPHVFNPHIQEARMDYRDWHGAVLEGGTVGATHLNGDPRVKPMDRFVATLKKVAGALEGMGDSETGQFFGRMARSLRLYAGIMRSANNFYATGAVRDRNKEKLAGPGAHSAEDRRLDRRSGSAIDERVPAR